jgi:hypothetical protein
MSFNLFNYTLWSPECVEITCLFAEFPKAQETDVHSRCLHFTFAAKDCAVHWKCVLFVHVTARLLLPHGTSTTRLRHSFLLHLTGLMNVQTSRLSLNLSSTKAARSCATRTTTPGGNSPVMAASTRPSRQKLQDLLHASMHAQKDEERQVMLDDMPSEMINAIFGYLRPHDLTKLACVSKKYRDITQSILWGSIELHRQDAHYDAYGLSMQKHVCRSYLDQKLRDPWSYRTMHGTDLEFHHRNAKFGTAIRKLYRTAGKS